MSAKDFLIAVYNSLEVKSDYRSDLVDLFGTPDASRKGYIGSLEQPICWDWGDTGFGKITQILYSLYGKQHDSFEEFYRSAVYHKDNIIQSLIVNGVIDRQPQMLYVFKHSSKKIPAFTAQIEKISWRKSEKNKWRIWLTYKPKSYMLLDPQTWRGSWNRLFTKGREDPQKWCDTWELSWDSPCPPKADIERMVHSGFTQDQYHILPTRLLLDSLTQNINPFSDEPRTCFIKDVSKNDKRTKLRVPTDNQAFWGILSEFIGKTQVRGTVSLRYDRRNYEITDIPSNTIVEDGLVFKQEIGTARTICQVMVDVFGKNYLDIEFSKSTSKNILDSIFLKRAVKVSMVAKTYEKKYGETDFDYQLDLTPLSAKHPKLGRQILFDLTAGLWNKSIARNKEEFLEQWEHNLIKLPQNNHNLTIFWHYGLSSEIKDGSYKGLEVGDYLLSKQKIEATKYQPRSIEGAKTLPRLVLLPFFRDANVKLEKELEHISSPHEDMRRKSLLYGALREMLERLR